MLLNHGQPFKPNLFHSLILDRFRHFIMDEITQKLPPDVVTSTNRFITRIYRELVPYL